MTILYTIIIPHKNTPLLLLRCLKSIPMRGDVQIIVVDDNSDSSIVDFNNYPGVNIPNVEIIFSKYSKGAGYARNLGLSKAKGKWILFADSDDFFNCCFSELIEKYKDSNSDIVYFNVNSVFSDTLTPSPRSEYYSNLIEKYYIDQNKGEDIIRYNFLTPWAKFIKYELIKENKIHFDEVLASNDVMFSIKTGHVAKLISIDKNALYCVTVTKGSLTNRRGFEILYSRYLVTLRANNFLRKVNKKQYRKSVIYFIISSPGYGISAFLKVLFAACKYRANIFIGMENWITTILNFRNSSRYKTKYITKE